MSEDEMSDPGTAELQLGTDLYRSAAEPTAQPSQAPLDR
jgi:hypothetical protein